MSSLLPARATQCVDARVMVEILGMREEKAQTPCMLLMALKLALVAVGVFPGSS